MIKAAGFEGRDVAVFGLGRSGLPAAEALRAGGARPLVWDDNPAARAAAETAGYELADLSEIDWGDLAALVLSPGVPLSHPAPHWTVPLAERAGVPVIGDVELFARAIEALSPERRPRVVGVTGTNGKSTTTALIGWALAQAGLDVRVGGNIGVGVLSLEPPVAGSVYIIEVSSYQLDLTCSFRPDAAILLNITPDHLERHGDMTGYAAAKARIFAAQRPGQTAIVNLDDAPSRAILDQLRSRPAGPAIRPISVREEARGGVWAKDACLFEELDGRVEQVCDLAGARSLRGRHNAQNAAAAYAALRALGVSRAVATRGLLGFPGLAHRMQEIACIRGVRFINDSKATNADAARQAMLSYPRFRWVAGGRAKAGGIDDLADLFPRVTKAYLVGESAGAFASALGKRAPHVVSGDIESAVAEAFADARSEGDREAIVLLSPAAASFDQFSDFEARGDAFRRAVMELAQREGWSDA